MITEACRFGRKEVKSPYAEMDSGFLFYMPEMKVKFWPGGLRLRQ